MLKNGVHRALLAGCDTNWRRQRLCCQGRRGWVFRRLGYETPGLKLVLLGKTAYDRKNRKKVSQDTQLFASRTQAEKGKGSISVADGFNRAME